MMHITIICVQRAIDRCDNIEAGIEAIVYHSNRISIRYSMGGGPAKDFS